MNIKFGADIYAPKEVNELARASIGYIESDVMDIKKRYVTLGFHLYEMDQCRYYEDLGYENLYECIEANFAMDKSAVSRCIGVWKAFAAVDGDGSRKMWVDDRYKDFSYSQLTEMLPMSERDRYRISSDMSVKKIREVKQRLKEKKSSENMKPVVEQEKDKISARGTRVNVREDDVVATSQLFLSLLLPLLAPLHPFLPALLILLTLYLASHFLLIPLFPVPPGSVYPLIA